METFTLRGPHHHSNSNEGVKRGEHAVVIASTWSTRVGARTAALLPSLLCRYFHARKDMQLGGWMRIEKRKGRSAIDRDEGHTKAPEQFL
jgi:hypothetical protein